MSATQVDQPAGPAGAPPIPVTLRAIAAWLESHPVALELRPYGIDTFDHLLWPENPVLLRYYPRDAETPATMVSAIGGDWEDFERYGYRHYRHAITPHAAVDVSLQVDGGW